MGGITKPGRNVKSGSRASKAKVSKPTNIKHKSKSKVKKAESKATKSKIQKLNANINEINEIQQLLGSSSTQETKMALDSKQLKEDLKEDEQTKSNNKMVNNDLTKQLELLTGMGL